MQKTLDSKNLVFIKEDELFEQFGSWQPFYQEIFHVQLEEHCLLVERYCGDFESVVLDKNTSTFLIKLSSKTVPVQDCQDYLAQQTYYKLGTNNLVATYKDDLIWKVTYYPYKEMSDILVSTEKMSNVLEMPVSKILGLVEEYQTSVKLNNNKPVIPIDEAEKLIRTIYEDKVSGILLRLQNDNDKATNNSANGLTDAQNSVESEIKSIISLGNDFALPSGLKRNQTKRVLEYVSSFLKIEYWQFIKLIVIRDNSIMTLVNDLAEFLKHQRSKTSDSKKDEIISLATVEWQTYKDMSMS